MPMTKLPLLSSKGLLFSWIVPENPCILRKLIWPGDDTDNKMNVMRQRLLIIYPEFVDTREIALDFLRSGVSVLNVLVNTRILKFNKYKVIMTMPLA